MAQVIWTETATQEKALIHEQIDRLQDPTDLNDLLDIVTLFIENRTTPMPESTPEEIERLRRQLRAIEEGRMKFTPHEQVMREMKEFMDERRKNSKL